jgi:ATP-dependent protease HslVU (ClpYQ) peptidase subunit
MQELINIVAGFVLTGIAGLVANMWSEHRTLERRVNTHEVEVARDYVRKDELTAILDRMDHKLDTISAKLDRKQDK